MPPCRRVYNICCVWCAWLWCQFKLALVLATLASGAFAAKGVDVSSLVLPSSWSCMRKDGVTFAVIRAYEQIGRPDSNAPHTIYNAWDGGMQHVDVYRTLFCAVE